MTYFLIFKRTQNIALSCILIIVISACSTRPAFPPGEIPRASTVSPEDEEYGQKVLATLTAEYPLSRNDDYINRVRDIVMRVAKAAHAENEPWHTYVLEGDSVVNAAATRGNHVFVWTGILHTVSNDDQLATVIAHELGHVLAGHTKTTADEEAGAILSEASGQIVGAVLQQTQLGPLANIAAAAVSELMKAIFVNPESQRQELEADQIGVFLMADAGYDPQSAITFWSRMAKNPGGTGPGLSFLSTHPANEDRLTAIDALMPAANIRYEATKHPKGKLSLPKEKPASKPQALNQGPVVTKGGAAVLSDPSPGAILVKELKGGQKVKVDFTLGDWVKISKPVTGFILKANLSGT